MAEQQTVDVDTFVDERKFGRYHVLTLMLATVLMMIDGYELYVVGWVLPALAEDFGVSRTALTPVLVAQQVGMVLGAYLITPLADKLGRPKVLLIIFAALAVSCAAILFVHDIPTFMACRVIAGMFASGALPILLSTVSEVAPKRYRATMTTILVSGAMGGALIGSLMQAFLLVPYGWRSAFWLGTLMPLAMLPVIWLWMTDSLRFIVARNPGDPRIPALVRKMGGEPGVIIRPPPAPAGEVRKAAFAQSLFGPGKTARTVFLWLAFMSSFTFISAGNWKTTIFHDIVGLDWSQVALATALGTGFGIVGNIAIGVGIDRWGFRRVLPTAFVIAAAGAVAMGLTASTISVFFVALVIMNIFQHGGQAGLASLAASLYPAAQRATGVGWAYGAGRIASILAPMLGALALSQAHGPLTIFSLFALPLASAGIMTFLLLSLGRAPAVVAAPRH